ncbi:Ppx/GppA phosphatase family protein [Sulfurospirillum diekertiae]|uniref:Guanosine-5'-triphosphate,3'-diphosphate pyrophosphatase n=1 Tax=Sulfurospirillum diekertiae TaxID=1854492 RepID=A0A1Y0HMR1_9BACT|nr:phosphatase [Sulfurospirillum diekertiae]ARU48856.1 Guanosine-5'-triphosphate,3'-diphosphate pyrophosphatase [Sulfurospirillum diekertiae]ASC93676.1 Guanosine-5'-triphosphate,3'-diphosphate pyrophosphatase [Sulfurospirillum diekertiae]
MIGCDLGSNTLRIVQMDCQTKERIHVYEKIVRTGKDLHVTGLICESSKQNILNALYEASHIFDFKNERCFCVTTEAMRIASNAGEILKEIETIFGLTFQIITGEKEAYLTSLAVENALKREGFKHQTYALFDLGGGSTEFTFCKDGTKQSQSFPFGIINVAERYSLDRELHVTRIVNSIDDFMTQHDPISSNFLQLVTTAGTPTTVAAFLKGLDYAHYDATIVNGTVLHVKDFDEAYERLFAMNEEDAERYTGTNRRDLVVVGILIVKAIMKKLGFESCIVIDDGLREGVALEQCYNLNKS